MSEMALISDVTWVAGVCKNSSGDGSVSLSVNRRYSDPTELYWNPLGALGTIGLWVLCPDDAVNLSWG